MDCLPSSPMCYSAPKGPPLEYWAEQMQCAAVGEALCEQAFAEPIDDLDDLDLALDTTILDLDEAQSCRPADLRLRLPSEEPLAPVAPAAPKPASRGTMRARQFSRPALSPEVQTPEEVSQEPQPPAAAPPQSVAGRPPSVAPHFRRASEPKEAAPPRPPSQPKGLRPPRPGVHIKGGLSPRPLAEPTCGKSAMEIDLGEDAGGKPSLMGSGGSAYFSSFDEAMALDQHKDAKRTSVLTKIGGTGAHFSKSSGGLLPAISPRLSSVTWSTAETGRSAWERGHDIV